MWSVCNPTSGDDADCERNEGRGEAFQRSALCGTHDQGASHSILFAAPRRCRVALLLCLPGPLSPPPTSLSSTSCLSPALFYPPRVHSLDFPSPPFRCMSPLPCSAQIRIRSSSSYCQPSRDTHSRKAMIARFNTDASNQLTIACTLFHPAPPPRAHNRMHCENRMDKSRRWSIMCASATPSARL